MTTTHNNNPVLNQGYGKLGYFALGWFVLEFGLYAHAIVSGIREGESALWLVGKMLFIFVCIRVVMVSGNFIQTWLSRSPRKDDEQIDLRQTVKLFFNELIAALWTYPFLFAFEPFLTPNRPAKNTPHQGPPIVLVPGFLCNRGYWVFMRRFLTQQGYANVYAVTLEPVFGSITRNAGMLAEFVEAVCEETGSDQVILIAHSMGGVTIRAYLHKHNGARRVARAIALGSPFQGTALAAGPQKLGRNLQQMVIGNPWAEEINLSQAEAAPVPFVAVWSPHDSIVAPQEGSKISPTYGQNICTPGIGHMEMVCSKPINNIVLDQIRQTSASA